ncbi:MAG: type II toxin-antitoxin system VapC family toxin [Acidimicrobiia bacterium]|nr:type II toxin-antitoxin system VapC family toxin [Acidimicrobiia bacterium]
MRLLLDTHVWLWLQAEPERLTPRILTALGDPTNDLVLSAASAWEITIKFMLGRLSLPEPPSAYIPTRMQRHGVIGLPVEHSHALAVAELPPHHRDPFDRLLIAQARLEHLTFVTVDPAVDSYEVARL